MMSAIRNFAFVSILLVVCSRMLPAQAVSGTILGSVLDPTGAAVPGASVTFLNADTGLTRMVTTNSDGEYDVPSLPWERTARVERRWRPGNWCKHLLALWSCGGLVRCSDLHWCGPSGSWWYRATSKARRNHRHACWVHVRGSGRITR
jgi:hypothetical protein